MEVVIEQILSEPQMDMFESTASINLFLAGVGSGKTYLDGLITRRFINDFPEIRGFIAANTYLQLEQSTLFRIREYWKSIGIVEYNKDSCPWGQYVINKRPPNVKGWQTKGQSFDDYYGIITFYNGCNVFIGSMDNAKAHEGKEFGWAVLDETKDTDESDVKEIILARLRQPGLYIVDGQLSKIGNKDQQWNPLYISTSPAKTPWIAEWFKMEDYAIEIIAKIYSRTDYFRKELDNKFMTISSTYLNVHNVGENYINTILQNNSAERGKALIFASPFATTGGEFYSSFDRLTHVSQVNYNPVFPIHISFDQNSVPYNSAGLSQVMRVDKQWNQWEWYWEWRIFDEIALENPRNSTEDVCEEFMSRYPNHKSGLYYYGDASGHSRHVSTGKTDYRHHYEVVEYKLRKYLVNDSDRTLITNPSIPMRRDFFNKIFEGKLPIRIVIDESCHYTINDFMYVKQALDGTKDKHIVEDKETGDKYQKYGHFSDLWDYCIVDLFKTYYNG